jgi:putative Mg2+ transporter-C (MgtC) family protein
MSHTAITIITRVLMALVFGGLIGLERELTDHPAGIRTHILVTMGAAIFTLMSLYGFPGFIGGDRVAAAVVTGIGFIGGGAILKSKGGFVVGLTTAASLWTVAAIGMLVGTGFLLVGFIVTAVDLLVLEAIDRLMDTISPKFKSHQVPVSVAGDYSEKNFGQVKDLLRSHGCKPDLLGFSRYDSGTQYDADLLTIVRGHLDIEKLTDEIYAVAGVKEVKWGQEFD